MAFHETTRPDGVTEEALPDDGDEVLITWEDMESEEIIALVGSANSWELVSTVDGEAMETLLQVQSHKDNALGDARRYMRENYELV